jgi:hypothetical protein
MANCRFCERPVVGRGLCRRHYMQERRGGRLDEYRVRERPLKDRFLAKVKKTKDCWLWVGHSNGYGYGLIWRDGAAVRAHRVAFELFCGSVSADEVVCHRCDNPKCVNPLHLFKGTRLDNNRDAAAKSRTPSGDRHWATRLSDTDISEIRNSSLRVCDLAAKYGVHQSHISKVRSGLRRR